MTPTGRVMLRSPSGSSRSGGKGSGRHALPRDKQGKGATSTVESEALQGEISFASSLQGTKRWRTAAAKTNGWAQQLNSDDSFFGGPTTPNHWMIGEARSSQSSS